MRDSDDIFILGIESSCDDTSAAVLHNGKILANITATQAIHEKYGGVVPELASRAHQKHIVPVVHQALAEAKVSKTQLSAIAYTKGPGLLGSLLVGSSFAKSLAQGLSIPAIPVHHMKAHVLAHFIETGATQPKFPFLCMTVSGGHTQILKVSDPFTFDILGETLDDAAGEAFDKAAKYLNLPYPGGPVIDSMAKSGNPDAFSFTKPKVEGLNFSFSGLKTNFINLVSKERQKNPDFDRERANDLAASIQRTIVEMLLANLTEASRQTGITDVALAGGVSANSELREALESAGKAEGWR
ncbi:MAG: tRNA (adenosine(37)-N6)-threonylcarbamoyltransferase complex transferase subunit TsaD, partial [Flavobacteriales bacterium]|nr:tRNA (adenosine(37)-N6)-threonylcarbamoyltransferase complex transferase subunit TsaD [Flavobacteriales bacterium]